ncbi:LVIVD repeat-containing protein [Saccharothrix sp. CCNWYY140]|uniref:LVIVD repeat-containing protein n=1 Tax=unclassified Saccharothrix TaxID=2593673 RepID=UPI003FD48E1F
MNARDSARRRRAGAALGALALAATSLVLGPQALAAPEVDADVAGLSEAQLSEPAQTGTEIPGVDEIRHTRNIKHLANLPKPAPFTEASTWSDLAFQGGYAFDGNYDGFVIYDIRNPHKPSIVSTVLCPGSQNDISVHGNLLFLSTDSSRTDNSCSSKPQPATIKESWEGVKVFDISDKRNPRYIAAVETKCGSHTHTLVPDKKGKDVYLYVSSYAPNATFPDCQPPHDLISIVKVPLKDPASASLLTERVLFPDGGNPGRDGDVDTGYVRATSGCHDITVYPSKDLAAGACMGDGVLWDISDRENPREINRVQDNVNFAFWHSATFNNAGTKVVFTDELGGGSAATCNPKIGPLRGADGIYDVTGQGDARKLEFRSYYKIPRTQADSENCVAHNGSLIPVQGRDIMVQAWYQGGFSVWDFTDSRNPKEIGWFERGPLPDRKGGGAWSTYYYNGYIFSSDMAKGFDVFDIRDPRTATAKLIRVGELNVQTQGHYRELFPR